MGEIMLIFLIICGLGISFCVYILIRNDYCYRKTLVISKWIYCYITISGEKDIDYDIDDFGTWSLILSPFRWTLRSMCNDKEKFDKLKDFISNHKEESDKLIKELRRKLW